MSLENYLLSYRAQNQNIIERNSRQHPTFIEFIKKE